MNVTGGRWYHQYQDDHASEHKWPFKVPERHRALIDTSTKLLVSGM